MQQTKELKRSHSARIERVNSKGLHHMEKISFVLFFIYFYYYCYLDEILQHHECRATGGQDHLKSQRNY